MELSVRAFWLPKNGNSVEEYEDAFEYSTTDNRFAIADGATESSFSGRWAKYLVQGFVNSPPSTFSSMDMQEWLNPLQSTWNESIDWDNLPWFSVDKARSGAFSSFLGLTFDPKVIQTKYHWSAIAIGDSCLFHIRDNSLLTSFPIERAEQFGNRPLLLSSNNENNNRVWDDIKTFDGYYQNGDIFLLATDALANWFLTQHENNSTPWDELCGLKTDDDFAGFVAKLRQNASLHNDDVTLLIIQVEFSRSNKRSRRWRVKI